MKEIALTTAIAVLLFASACRTSTEAEPEVHAEASAPAPAPAAQPSPSPSSDIPNLQAEILDDRLAPEIKGNVRERDLGAPCVGGVEFPGCNDG